MEIQDIVKTAVKAIDSKKGENIEVIGITDLTIIGKMSARLILYGKPTSTCLIRK